MIIKLDGIKRESIVPVTVPRERKAVVWARGEDGTIEFTLRGQYGDPVNLTGGFLFLAIRELPVDLDEVIEPDVFRQATPVDVANGRADFTIAAADTVAFKEGVSYHFDVWFVDASGDRWQVVPDSQWLVAASNSEPDDVPTEPPLPAPLIPLFGPPVATWDAAPENARRYAIDPIGGIDTAVGYADGLSSAAWQAAAPWVAVKTWKRLREVLPPVGYGHSAVIYIKGNATTGVSLFKADGVTLDNLDLRGLIGYYELRVEPTFDWSESLSDKLKCGGIIDAAGPNVDGSWSVAAGSTASVVNVAGASALPAKMSLIGKRIRFAGDVTAGLLNSNSNAYRRNSDFQLTLGIDTVSSIVPAAGDDFFIERPGIRVNDIYVDESYCNQLIVTGIDCVQSTMPSGRTAQYTSNVVFTFCAFAVCYPRIRGAETYLVSISHNERTSGVSVNRRVGACFGAVTATLIVNVKVSTWQCHTFLSMASNLDLADGVGNYSYGAGSWQSASCRHRAVGRGSPFVAGGRSLIGNSGTASIRPLWIDSNATTVNGGICLIGECDLLVYGVDINNLGNIPGVLVQCANSTIGINGLQTTEGGNTGPSVSFDINPPPVKVEAYFGLLAANASIGSGADIQGAGSVKCTFAQLADFDFYDGAGNHFIGGTIGQVTQNLGAQMGTRLQSAEGAATGLLGQAVRADGTGKFLLAQANNSGNASGFLGVLANQALAGEYAMVVPDGFAVVRFASAPPASGPAYLSEATAGMAASASPAVSGTNQKLRLGIIAKQLTSPLAICRLKPELVPVTSDGNP